MLPAVSRAAVRLAPVPSAQRSRRSHSSRTSRVWFFLETKAEMILILLPPKKSRDLFFSRNHAGISTRNIKRWARRKDPLPLTTKKTTNQAAKTTTNLGGIPHHAVVKTYHQQQWQYIGDKIHWASIFETLARTFPPHWV